MIAIRAIRAVPPEEVRSVHEGERPMSARDALIDAVALNIAKAQDGDYWGDEISAWEASEVWEREAHPENYPADAYEDREWYRGAAVAALEAVVVDFREWSRPLGQSPDDDVMLVVLARIEGHRTSDLSTKENDHA